MTSRPHVPHALHICATCRENVAGDGEIECAQCSQDRLSREAFYVRFGDVFGVHVPPRITEVPREEDAAWQPRRRVIVPAGYHAAVAIEARRMAVWLSLLLLAFFTAGWLFGRFG